MSNKMYRKTFSFLLVLVGLVAHYSSGTRTSIKVESKGSKLIEEHQVKTPSSRPDLEPTADLNNNGIHPDHLDLTVDTYSSLDAIDEHISDARVMENDHEVWSMVEHSQAAGIELEKLVHDQIHHTSFPQYAEQPLDLSKPKPFDNPRQQWSKKKVEPIDLRIRKKKPSLLSHLLLKPNSFFDKLPAISSEMVELQKGSGVWINRNKLISIYIENRHTPRELQRLIFEELISPMELATMKPTFHEGYKVIPRNIVDAVEAFIKQQVDPAMSHRIFKQTLWNHLRTLRKKYNIN